MRTAFRLASAAVFAVSLAAASPAAAAPTSTAIGSEATAANAAGLGGCFCNVIPISVGAAPGYAIPHDGVITRWSFRRGDVNGLDDTVRLRTYRRVDVATAPVVSESAPAVVAGSGGAQTSWSRVPARAGNVLGGTFHTTAGVDGTRPIFDTGSAGDKVDYSFDSAPAFLPLANRRVNIAAVLESDEDADGFGDVSQDLCLGDAAHGASACSGTLLGSDLQGPTRTAGSCLPACELAQLRVPGGASAAAPARGVIVRWRLLSPRPGSYRLRVIAPAPATPGAYVRGEPSAPVVVAAGAGLITTPTRISIPAGGYATLLVPSGGNPASAVPAPAGAASTVVTGDPAGGAGAPAGLGSGSPGLLHYDADVEPDADGDGFGDVTQDGCPSDAGTAGACPEVPGPSPAPTPTPGPGPAPGPAPASGPGQAPGPAATPGPVPGTSTRPGSVAAAPRVISIARSAARFRVPRRGTTFTVTTSARTKVRFTIQRLRGRRSILVHRFTRTLEAGPNGVAYSGRYVVRGRARRLALGRYQVQAAAVNRAGRVGPSKAKAFTVVRGRRTQATRRVARRSATRDSPARPRA